MSLPFILFFFFFSWDLRYKDANKTGGELVEEAREEDVDEIGHAKSPQGPACGCFEMRSYGGFDKIQGMLL